MPDTFSMARLKHKTSSRIHLTRSFDHGNIAPAADHQAVEARDHEKAAEEGQAPGPSRQMSTLVWSLVVASTFSSLFIYALDSTIVADLVPAIVEDFDSVSRLPWLSVGFSLGSVVLAMPFGSMYGVFDAKWLYIVSTLLFMAASALCGAAPTMTAEIVGRVLAGAGGNGMYLGVLTLLSVNTTNKDRPVYLGLTGLIWGVGTVLGPVVGGGFERISWRWAFYLNLFIGALCAPAYLFLIPSFDPADTMGKRDRLRKLDWLGALLSAGGFTTLTMGVSFGGALFAWSNAREIVLFVLAGVLWILFFVQQSYAITTKRENRVFPVHLLVQREPALLFLSMAAGSAGVFVGIYYTPIYFQFTRGDSGIQAAVRLLPFLCFLSATILINGALLPRLGYYKIWYIVGSVLACAGGAVLSRLTVDTRPAIVYGLEIVIATGLGCYCQSGYAVIQARVPPQDMANSRTFMMIAQLSGIGFGLAISGAIFVNDAQTRLEGLDLPISPSDLQQLIAGTNAAVLDSLTESDRSAILSGIVASLRKVFVPLYASAAVSLVCGIFMPSAKAH